MDELERFAPEEEPDRILRHVHRALGPFLKADLGFVWRFDRSGRPAAFYRLAWTPKGEKALSRSDIPTLTDGAVRFARDRKSPGDRHLLLTWVPVEGRTMAVLGFLRPGGRFGRIDARFANEAAQILSRHLAHRERERTFEIRERIVRKVLQQLRPADILYQVLHGLKRLLQYDHGASVQTFDPEASVLTIRAETIAWTKGKSPRIGSRIPVRAAALAEMESLARCHRCDPARLPDNAPAALIADLTTVTEVAPPVRSLLLAPLRQGDRFVGLLSIRSTAPEAFTKNDEETINSFLPILSATALHSEYFRLQQDRLFEAERRTALGDLARAISHDLNNSFGVIQPLLDALRRDVERGTLSQENLRRDLETLSQYTMASLRIFEGLLGFARGSVEGIDMVDVPGALDAVLSLLDRGLRSSGIEVVKEIPADLPRLRARRQAIEQLFLNLITNAKDSMHEGGRLTIRMAVEPTADGDAMRITVSDTGVGIAPDMLARVFEPFFTTKAGGTGLGLDICRSLVWEQNGDLWLESKVGEGTQAQIRFPIRSRLDPAPGSTSMMEGP